MDKPRYTIPFDFDDPTRELTFNELRRAPVFPKRLYGETSFEVVLDAKKSGIDFDFTNMTSAFLYLKITNTAVVETSISSGSDIGNGDVLFVVDKDQIPNSYAQQTSPANPYPITVYLVVESSDAAKISLETQIAIMDINRSGTQDNSILDATGIDYNPSDIAKWTPYFGTPTTVEEALNKLAFADRRDQGSIIDKDLSIPPGSPLQGDRYIPAAVATGAWVGLENMVVEWDGTAWVIFSPREGDFVYIADENKTYRFDTVWSDTSPITAHGLLTGLANDDHTQYLLADGTRAVTGEMAGVSPALSSGLTTKGYVDTAIANALSGFTDLGVVTTRAVAPPAHGAGVKVLIDTNLGAPSGAFIGHDNEVAVSDGTSVWTYITPVEGDSVWIDDENTRYSFDADGVTWAKAAAGETNTASNLGTGIGVFSSKVSVDLQFNSIKNGVAIATTLSTNDIVIDFDMTSLANEAAPASGMKLPIDNAGTISYVDWNQLPTGSAALNVGTGIGVFKQQVGNTFEFYSIKAGTNTTVSLSGDDILVNVATATEAQLGVVELATSAETLTGSSNSLSVHPLGLKTNYLQKVEDSNNQIGTAYTMQGSTGTTDLGKVIWMNNAAANVLTIDTELNQTYSSGFTAICMQEGAGQTTITAAAGVTLNGTVAGSVVINNQYQGATLVKRSSDVWIVSGDIT